MRFLVEHFHAFGWNQTLLKDQETGTFAQIIPQAGGILNGFGTQVDGLSLDVIDGYRDYADWQARYTQGFHSAKMSPYVCRVGGSSYQWADKRYELTKFKVNGTAIHGLLCDAPFTVIEEAIHNDYAEVELKYAYAGQDPGFPFAYDCYLKYRLEETGRLSVLTAIHNRSNSAIPVADGWHPYFTLGKPIDQLELHICSLSMLEYDAGLIPTGNLLPCLDWLDGRKIGDTTLDNGFVLDFTMTQPLCTLADPDRGIQVEFYPDFSYPYLQVYTPPHRNSIAIENISAAPDAFNNKIGLVTLDPDHTKTFTTRYRIAAIQEE